MQVRNVEKNENNSYDYVNVSDETYEWRSY